MQISREISESHRQLSPTSRQFLEFVRENPDLARPFTRESCELPAWFDEYFTHSVQPWPTFVSAEKLRQIKSATMGLSQLVKSLNERIFDNNVERIADFYGFGDNNLLELMLMQPNCIDEAFSRNDFIDSPTGFKCLETNMQTHLGGWGLRFFVSAIYSHPLIEQFSREQGVDPIYRDPFEALFDHVVEDTLSSGVDTADGFNVAFAFYPDTVAQARHSIDVLNAVYLRCLLKVRRDLEGRVFVCSPDELKSRSGGLFLGDVRIHSLVHISEDYSPDAFRNFKSGTVRLYNGPIERILADKRNLALLSQKANSDRFDAQERALIRDHVPWCRIVQAGEVEYRGENLPCPELLRLHRAGVVLKQAWARAGQGVHVGRHTTPERWAELVGQAVASGGKWIVQEHVVSRPFLYQFGESGWAPHDVVWGMFSFGRHFGGGYLRMMPQENSDGVINSARGAANGLILEV